MNPYLLVGIGGVLGCLARFAVSNLVGSTSNGFPLAIFVINVIGSTAMGVFVGVLAKTTPQFQNEIRLFFAVGVLGGFTTFSSFSLDAITLIERGDILLAGLYIVGSVIFALAGLWLGMLAVRVVM
jgi:CrcB protein